MLLKYRYIICSLSLMQYLLINMPQIAKEKSFVYINMCYGHSMKHNKRESQNAFNWQAISVPPRRLGSCLINKIDHIKLTERTKVVNVITLGWSSNYCMCHRARWSDLLCNSFFLKVGVLGHYDNGLIPRHHGVVR